MQVDELGALVRSVIQQSPADITKEDLAVAVVTQALELQKQKVITLLEGIDQCECSALGPAWWETSTGAAFGEDILNKIKAL